jgi:hypothetical protein
MRFFILLIQPRNFYYATVECGHFLKREYPDPILLERGGCCAVLVYAGGKAEKKKRETGESSTKENGKDSDEIGELNYRDPYHQG